ncbi:HAD-like domain-containing protein [Schizophyllum amplum]|uniref:HAD-like domain-containing protein n=1 Tax=Schizophyllum amplum TaxID=97359 RepID=A0A550CTM4_9AGAR|nr:HAD-like domain-containing protein [Auriculariopsis ampla]
MTFASARTKVVLFDLMGTCVDWKSSIVAALEECPHTPGIHPNDYPQLAADWRAGFCRILALSGQQSPDIDDIHRDVLDGLLADRGVSEDDWSLELRARLVSAWHHQLPWSDTVDGLRRISEKHPTVVLANGTTRLQLDIVRSAGIHVDALFSSKLLGFTKPDRRIYEKALEMLECAPEEAVMIAAHSYDLRAASKLGIRTIYVQRITEDPTEDREAVRNDVDFFVDGINGGGLGAVADILGC